MSQSLFEFRKAAIRNSFEDCGLYGLTASIIVIPEND
jgi:hypothetical protein